MDEAMQTVKVIAPTIKERRPDTRSNPRRAFPVILPSGKKGAPAAIPPPGNKEKCGTFNPSRVTTDARWRPTRQC
jgi:hypothetical protein